MATVEKTGGCQCGRVRYRVAVDPVQAYPCHCRMCQRATGGVYAAMVGAKATEVAWEGEPAWYPSSAIAERAFCGTCGSPLAFRYVGADMMDFTIGTLDDAADCIPRDQFGFESHLPAWQDLSPVPAIRSDEYAPLQARWRAAGEGPPA